LALLDHCPNVVVEARASGCKIVCSSAGGTKEIAGPDSIVVGDVDWDWKPFELYKPPPLDFSRIVPSADAGQSIDIADVATLYEKALLDVASKKDWLEQ
jgi:hypothetical protein